MNGRRIVWFSCGAASAVAAKLTLDTHGTDNAVVVYCDTLASEHPDNERFFNDVQTWLGVEILKIKSKKYDTIDDVFEQTRYMAGVNGARCTTEMKKIPRYDFQTWSDIHVFGFTFEEQNRIDAIKANHPELQFEWILRDNNITKQDCFTILFNAGIRLPEMYRLGFNHNNCSRFYLTRAFVCLKCIVWDLIITTV